MKQTTTNVGLVLEGGGLRGTYTAGVLDTFIKHNIEFPYVIGVSAGACIAFSYLAKQIDRDRHIMTTYINDPRYFSLRNLIKEGNIFSRKFIYDEMHRIHVPLDMAAFNRSSAKFLYVSTNCLTGKPVYFDARQSDFLTTLASSASLPFVSRMVEHNGMKLLDGGIVDSIPIRKAITDGNSKNVIVLTRPPGYRKKKAPGGWLIKTFYRKYPLLAQAIIDRYQGYNETLELIEKLEKEKKVMVIRPSVNLQVARIEKDATKLNALHALGVKDTEKVIKDLLRFKQ